MGQFLSESVSAKLSRRIESRMKAAFDAFRLGGVLSEEPYMSHLNQKLQRGPCKIPDNELGKCVTVTPHLKVLHRQGIHNRDEYGADLAVRLHIDGAPPASKIAFFQVKLSENGLASIDLNQLRDLTTEPLTRERGFVVFLDKDGGTSHVSFAQHLWNKQAKDRRDQVELVSREKTRRRLSSSVKVDAGSATAREWIRGWLVCTVGPRADQSDPAHSVFELKWPFSVGQGEPEGRVGRVLVAETVDIRVRRG